MKSWHEPESNKDGYMLIIFSIIAMILIITQFFVMKTNAKIVVLKQKFTEIVSLFSVQEMNAVKDKTTKSVIIYTMMGFIFFSIYLFFAISLLLLTKIFLIKLLCYLVSFLLLFNLLLIALTINNMINTNTTQEFTDACFKQTSNKMHYYQIFSMSTFIFICLNAIYFSLR